jgi:hypothetical protein
MKTLYIRVLMCPAYEDAVYITSAVKRVATKRTT